MTLQWADFPSGQQGIYGLSEANMLDGTPWVNMQDAILTNDPDSVNFPDGIVLRHGSSAAGAGAAARLALDTPNAEVGVEHRFYASELPERSLGRPFLTFNSTGNAVRYQLSLMPNGALRIYFGTETIGAGTLIADTVAPVIFANTWNHIGMRVNVVTGEIEVRKNGTPIPALTFTHGSPPGGTVGIVGFPENYSGDSGFPYFFTKDLIVWNGLGTEFNDFQGTVGVHDLYPNSDETLGTWTLSSGTTGYTLVDETTPDDSGYIEAAVPPQTAIEFGFTDLPIDITSVRAVMPIMRGFGSSSGDGEVQIGLSPDGGSNVDTGAEHYFTTSAAYYWDISTLSPATAAAWTPTEINNLTATYDRVL